MVTFGSRYSTLGYAVAPLLVKIILTTSDFKNVEGDIMGQKNEFCMPMVSSGSSFSLNGH